MKFTLSTKIGIIGFILVLIIALTTVMVGAQSPYETASPASTVTLTASPTNTPAIKSFTVDITQTKNGSTPANTADVKLSVKQNNFDLTTQTPTSTATPTKAEGLIKYCYDMPAASISATGTASPYMTSSPGAGMAQTGSPPVESSAVPTATNNSILAMPGACVLSTETSFTFTSVPMGVHTFSIELVNHDGSSMSPRLYINIELNVVPTP